MNTDILIIGGGASGLVAALSAKKQAPAARVTIAEKLPRVGKKLLATGNGRCNIMNALADEMSYAGNSAFIAPALRLYKEEYAAFWKELGLFLMTEDEGRMYPACNQASAVLDVLRMGLQDRGIEEKTDCAVTAIKKSGDGFAAESSTGTIHCKKVILCTGGQAGKGLGENDSFRALLSPLGHKIKKTLPALTWLKAPAASLTGLKGVRMKGTIRLTDGKNELASETGEVLFQESAVSGIAAMQLSLVYARVYANNPAAKLSVVLSPLAMTKDEAKAELLFRRERFGNRSADTLLTGSMNRLIALLALKRSGISPGKPAKELTGGELDRLASELTAWTIPVLGTGDFTSAQLMYGGADTDGFYPETLESKTVNGLYACGELLNVAGPCGGYNLEWAWACGMLAGRSAGKSLSC